MLGRGDLTPTSLSEMSFVKELYELSLEELWELFPIFLTEHDDKWKDLYDEIEIDLLELLAAYPIDRISHIGSTAIQGIWAKNIIDVLVELPGGSNMKEAAQVLEKNGFLIMSTGATRISLNKGYTKDGYSDKVYHIHLRYSGDNDELYFRDYLNENREIAKEYEALKLNLWKKYKHDRDAYTDAKTDFIRRWTQKARSEYGDKY